MNINTFISLLSTTDGVNRVTKTWNTLSLILNLWLAQAVHAVHISPLALSLILNLWLGAVGTPLKAPSKHALARFPCTCTFNLCTLCLTGRVR